MRGGIRQRHKAEAQGRGTRERPARASVATCECRDLARAGYVVEHFIGAQRV